MRFAPLALAAILSTSVAFSTAQALTIVQTQGFIGKPNLIQKLEFDRFDSSKGILDSVEVRMDLRISGGSLAVDNDGPQSAALTVELGATGSISSASVHLLDGNMSPILSGPSQLGVATGASFTLAPENGDKTVFDPNGPDGAAHQGGSAATYAGAYINSNYLSDFIGTTMYDMQVNVNQLLNFGSVGGISGQFEPVDAEVTVTVTYDFHKSVPEPTTFLTAGMGMLGFVGIARRYRKAH